MFRCRARVALCGAMLALRMSGACEEAWGASPPSTDTLESAAAKIEARDFDSASQMLRRILSIDPSDRRARELLAFALESSGDLAEERRVRAGLAADFPLDPRILADYGRVLERSGDERGALREYRRAQALNPATSARELDAAIERTSGRTAPEVGVPVTLLSDPDAVSSRMQAGATVMLGARGQVAVLGTHEFARACVGPVATTVDRVTVAFVDRLGTGAAWSIASYLNRMVGRAGTGRDVGAGAAITGRAALGASFEVDGRAEIDAPWDEAAVTMLHGGRTSGGEAHVYAHALDRRVLLQIGGLERRLSIVETPSMPRAFAAQRLGVAGADLVLWQRPANAVRGEMLDERMMAPMAKATAIRLAYRHYEVSTRPTPAFAAIMGLVPRGAVDEGSIAASLVSRGGRAGLELRAGLGKDAARATRMGRAGGELIWAPTPTTRLTLGHEGATELVAGLVGRRHTTWMSLHVDL